MKGFSCWYICGALLIALLLVLASATDSLPISLPVAMLVGLGLPAATLLIEHRIKMIEILGSPPNNMNEASS